MRYLIIIIVLLLLTSRASFASEIPNFGSCANPEGKIKIVYENGVHGIVGNENTFTGKDVVYELTETTLVQCFCEDNGSGIQTNWWEIGSIERKELETLLNQGWIYVPDGSLWGLNESAYIAKNSGYSCKVENENSIGGSIQSNINSSSSILGFANTGNSLFLTMTLFSGVVALFSGIVLRKK